MEKARDILEKVLEEEQQEYDSKPESFKDGDDGEKMEDVISKIDTAYDYADCAYCAVSDLI